MTFEEWARDIQKLDLCGVDASTLAFLKRDYEEGMARLAAWRASDAPAPSARQSGELRVAVAIEDDQGLGLTFWIKRSARGEVFLFYPRDRGWDPHFSYHLDGRCHDKSFGHAQPRSIRQPLTTFDTTEHLGTFAGHGAGPRIRRPASFDDIIVAPAGVLRHDTGRVIVDLVAPNVAPASHHREPYRIVEERTYRDREPWIVVGILEGPE